MSVQEWLSMLCLDVYVNNLLTEGFSSVEKMTDITWEDLEDIGIHKLGIGCLSATVHKSLFANDARSSLIQLSIKLLTNV